MQVTQEDFGRNGHYHSNYHYLEHVCYADKSFSKRFNVSSTSTANAAINVAGTTMSNSDGNLRSNYPQCCSEEESDVKEFLKEVNEIS